MKRHLLSSWIAVVILGVSAFAQDPALLRPPKGAAVAMVVFQDLQCPMCRTDAPLEEKAAKAHKNRIVRHDIPHPMHNLSINTALIASYYDSNTKDLGNQIRELSFDHKSKITPD